jgi:hypothetical protein
VIRAGDYDRALLRHPVFALNVPPTMRGADILVVNRKLPFNALGQQAGPARGAFLASNAAQPPALIKLKPLRC